MASGFAQGLDTYGGTLDLFAWLTLANGNPETFADAETNANIRGTRWAGGGVRLAGVGGGQAVVDERDHQGQERRERDAHLAGGGAVSRWY